MICLIKNKKYPFLFFLLLVFVSGYSQVRIKISAENKSCGECDIFFLREDSIIYNSYSDTKGYLFVPKYILESYTRFEVIMSNGTRCYQKKRIIDLSKGLNCETCNIVDSMKSIDLNEVVVYAKRDIIQDFGNKLVYNVSKDLMNTNVTTSDILRRTPLVSVDIGGTPSIKGSRNVKILINNREVSGMPSSQVIEQIPSGDVEKIEVITSPGAKYDAEGTSGIINIITRKKLYLKSSGYANLGIGTKGSHLFANYSYNINDTWSILNTFSTLISYSKTKSEQTYSGFKSNKQDRNSRGKNNGTLFSNQLTLSKTSKIDNLNIYLNYYSQNMSLNETLQGESQEGDNQRYNKLKTENGYSFYKIAVDYTRKLSDVIKIDVSSSGFYLPINNKMKVSGTENKYNYSIMNNTNNIDMEIAFSKKTTLDLGGKASLNFFDKDKYKTNTSPKQMTFATYFDGMHKFTNKLTLGLGIRFENYKLKGLSDINKNYKDYFYNGNISYRFDNRTTLSFFLNKRIQRPYYSSLLPIVSYTSSNIISVGNPDLNPEISYNYEIGFSKFIGDQFFKISPFYNHTNNKISNILSFKENVFYTNYSNIDYGDDFGINLWLSLNFIKRKLNINYGFDFIYKKLAGGNLKSNGTRFLNNVNITYKIKDDFYINFFGTFNTFDIYIQGKENSYTYNNLSLQKEFYQGNLKIAISVDNPFNRGTTIKQKYTIDTYSYSNQLTYYNRGIRLFFIYKFGKKAPNTTMKMQDDILRNRVQ